MAIRSDLERLATQLAECRALLASALNTQNVATKALSDILERADKAALNSLSSTDHPPSPHRRAHRPGRPPKIDADPELQAFIAARIDRMTFVEVETEVANHFPPDRRVR